MDTVTTRCNVCHFPLVALATEKLPFCRQCEMIADDVKNIDGSDPAEGLHASDTRYIRIRVASIRHAREMIGM